MHSVKMNLSKCINCFSRKCPNYFMHSNGMKISSRFYSAVMKKKFKSPFTCIAVEKSFGCFFASPSPLSSLRSYSQAPEMNSLPGDNLNNFTVLQPVKFDDMSFEPTLSHDDLLAALLKCHSVSDQLETLATTLALPPEDVQKRIRFCKTLETLFHPFFKDFKIQIFGSTVNCFGFKGCDIDMTFETTSTEKKEKAFYLERPDVPLVSEVLSGKVSPQEISELPIKEQLLFIHTVLLEYYKETSKDIIFINAHVPLVRFYHDKFDLKCDLTFKNLVAYKNTKLMYLFTKLDKRVVPLMMTFRYWAKHLEVVAKGLAFNTYTISLMVIYFLQSRSPPILPSAEYIMSLSNNFENDDMSDKSFLDIIKKIPPSQNTQPLGELLKDFFFFYLYFDFTRVICPITAKSVPREEFFSAEENRKFRMNTICVQDPMCLPHNVAELVDYKHCKKLFNELMITCQMFQDKYSFVPSSNPWGLMTLLDKPSEYSPNRVAVPKAVSFEIPLVSNTGSSDISIHRNASLSADTLLKILHHVLLFECRPLEYGKIRQLLQEQDALVARQKKDLEGLANARMEYQKIRMNIKKKSNISFYESSDENLSRMNEDEISMLEQFEKINIENELVLCTECKTSKNTWVGRDLINMDTIAESSDNIFDREHLISVQAAKQNYINMMDKKIKPFMFLFECYSSKNKPDSSLVVNLRPLQRMSFNPILGIFLKEYVPKLIKRINEEGR